MKRLTPFLTAVSAVLMFTCSVRAQDVMTPPELLKSALAHIQAERYEDGIAMLYMYLGEVEDSQLPRVIVIAQQNRFRMANLLIGMRRYEEAAAVLEDYISKPAAEHPREARKLIATAYYEVSDYERCVTACNDAILFNQKPVEAEQAPASDDEAGIGTVVDQFAEYLTGVIEEPYSDEELVMLHMTLGESHYALKNWAECIPAFEYVIEHTDDDQRKGYAIMEVINSLIELSDYERIIEWVPQLYRTDARFDIRVNMALMNAAAVLYDEGEYDASLPLYRMILPRGELIAYQTEQVRTMRIEAGLPPAMDEEMTAAEKLLFGVSDEREAETNEVDAASGLLVEKPKKLIELENLIIALKELPPYENDIDYRMAQLYKTVERYYEGLHFFDRVFAAAPNSEVGERSIYEIVDSLLNNVNKPVEAQRRGMEYMSAYHTGTTPRQIAYMLTGYHQQNGEMELIKELKPALDGLVRTNEASIIKYDTELYFMQAVADLVLQNFAAAEKGFRYVLDEFPDSHQEANSLYWYAMSKLFLQDYAGALPDFENYIKRFSAETYVDECHFQAGVCLFGMEKYDEAQKRFSMVINTWPDSSVYPEACSMRGDLYGSKGLLDEAIADYERAIQAATKAQQATYATFQMAEVYEAEDKYDDIIRVVERYLDTWGSEADIAKALFWIGKTKIQQDKVEEAVQTYVEAIIKYGTDVTQDGVDLMIAELEKVATIFLDEQSREQLSATLEQALQDAESQVLELRLRVLLAKLNDSEVELGRELISELSDFKSASPPVLACICRASFEDEDYSRSEELLNIFITRFEDSDYMRAAYKLRGFGQFEQQDYDGALQTIEEAQETYGTAHDVAWAQLMKARIHLARGEIDPARKANQDMLNVPSWRGEPVAQATYQLGQVEEKAGDPLKAFGFYQRTYFQYKGHAGGHWAAEAYLASARCLEKMGRANDVRNTYRAMLFDPYVNTLPQAEVAREALGRGEVAEIEAYIATGGSTNISVTVEVPDDSEDAGGEGTS